MSESERCKIKVCVVDGGNSRSHREIFVNNIPAATTRNPCARAWTPNFAIVERQVADFIR